MSEVVEREFSRKNLEVFSNCLARLDEMLNRWEREPDDEAVRDSVIKRFELTYELAVKTLQRYLLWTAPSEERVAGYDFPDLIRKGKQSGLLRTGWPEWKDYRVARNKTVHTYREDIAIEVATCAHEFAEEVRVLLENLNQRMSKNA